MEALWKGTLIALVVVCAVSLGVAQGKVAGAKTREGHGKERTAAQAKAQVVTVTGTVKSLEEIAQPEGAGKRTEAGAEGGQRAEGAAAGKGERPAQREAIIGCTLTTEQGEVKVALAPQRMLDRLGLALKVGDTMTVTGTQNPRQGMQLLANAVECNGNTYTLRQPQNPLANAKPATATGTVKDLVLGEGQKGGARLMLVTEDGQVPVNLCPAPYLQQIGLVLEEGKQITVNGWLPQPPAAAGREGKAAQAGREGKTAQAGREGKHQQGNMLIAREVVVDGKTFALRDENGKPAWENRGQRDTAAGGKERTRNGERGEKGRAKE